jgi:hypothetical protein
MAHLFLTSQQALSTDVVLPSLYGFYPKQKILRQLHIIRGSVSSAQYLSSLHQVMLSVTTGLHNPGHQVTVATKFFTVAVDILDTQYGTCFT